MNLWTIFLTGLVTGGLTCLAVQGGLLAATIAQRESSFAKAMEDKEERLKEKALTESSVLPIIFFLTAKLAAYTILGLLLGLLGSVFQLSLTTKIIMQLAVGIFMIGTALNLLDVHPIFRYFIIQPPKFLFRLIRNESKSKSIFAPLILGAFTVFIPCGTTQAMMALAVGSGNPLLGSAIMFAFVLGTSPTFFIIGFLVTRLGNLLNQAFMKVVAYTIILLAVFNLNAASAMAGSNLTLENLWREIDCTVLTFCNAQEMGVVEGAATQNVTITLTERGYSPGNIAVKAGSQVTMHLQNTTGRGCIQSFVIPKLGIEKIVRLGTAETVQFTAPEEKGNLAFMCGMGMYRGNIKVI
ncbi:sulfite exporter TauE/SafE family protein [Candidatus Gottesmanbacteria bacterium]|nr:sulfite exporter TauE/SafE family protein [Candidatus Gottesmanbacteria bacterium]MBI5451950.1 sulfite exporter TauE/SafE family protein [Candidatus Gottesmanbacteria bacterium]